MKTILERVQKRIFEHVYNTSSPVKAKPTQALFNNQCHRNAVEYARTHKDVEVVMGLIFNVGAPYLHFWNKKGNKHLETTFGHECDQWSYYPMRIIKPVEYESVRVIFDEACEYWFDNFVTWWEKFLIAEDRVV
jgi:hypothetical protein